MGFGTGWRRLEQMLPLSVAGWGNGGPWPRAHASLRPPRSHLNVPTSKTLLHPCHPAGRQGTGPRLGAASAQGTGRRQSPGRVRRRPAGRQPLATPPLSGKPPGRRGNVAAGNQGSPRGSASGCWPRGSRVQLRWLGTDTACPDRAGSSPGPVLPKSQTGPSSRLWASPDTGPARPGPSPSSSLLSADPKLWPRPPRAPCGLRPGSRPPWVAPAEVRHRDLVGDVSLC